MGLVLLCLCLLPIACFFRLYSLLGLQGFVCLGACLFVLCLLLELVCGIICILGFGFAVSCEL